jgi:nucleoside 2-deoxyribosyltransferase
MDCATPEAAERRALIYRAGPLFSEAERRFNLELRGKLEALAFPVFLPQRDGVEREKPPYDTMTPEERRQTMFHLDRQQILDSNVTRDGLLPETPA